MRDPLPEDLPPIPPNSIEQIDHMTLPAADLASAERFYVDLLGLSPVRRSEHGPRYLALRCGSVELDVFLDRDLVPGPPRAHPHLAFGVDPETLDLYRTRLQRAGIPVDGPRRLGPPGQASIYFADPSGNLLELSAMGYDGEVLTGLPALEALGRAGEGSERS